jgi:hypothetical protein
MNHSTDPVRSLKPRDSARAPLAMLRVFAVIAGLTAYLAWPARRCSTSTRQRQVLIAYLRDHLSGADLALRVVHRLGATHEGTEVGTLFRRLSERVGRRPLRRSHAASAVGSVRPIDQTSGRVGIRHRAERDGRR